MLLLWAASIVEPMALLVACHLTNKMLACLLVISLCKCAVSFVLLYCYIVTLVRLSLVTIKGYFLASQCQCQSGITNVAKITKSYYEDHEGVVAERALQECL